MAQLQPISFDIDITHRLRRAIFQGVITEPILFQTYTQLLSEPDYDPTLDDLVDMSLVERLEVSSRGIRQLVELFADPAAAPAANKLAIVSAKDHIFGMARMYEILSSNTLEQIQVFRNLKEAERWLGILSDDDI